MSLPPLPHHPEPHTMTWTALEERAIAKYGQACYDAAMRAAEAERDALRRALADLVDRDLTYINDVVQYGLKRKDIQAARDALASASPADHALTTSEVVDQEQPDLNDKLGPLGRHWVSIRAQVIEAVAREGFEILSNGKRVWLGKRRIATAEHGTEGTPAVATARTDSGEHR